MSESKKFCKHSDGLGYCDILSDNETRQYCVEGPCPHEELVEYVPVVRCYECNASECDDEGGVMCWCHKHDTVMKITDFCSYGKIRE